MKYISTRNCIFLYLCWIAAILWLSLTSHPPQTELALLSWDKFQHALAYGILAALGAWSFRGFFSRRFAGILSLSVAIAFGGVVELLQGMTSSRSAEWMDLVADAAGAAVFIFFYLRRGERGEGVEP